MSTGMFEGFEGVMPAAGEAYVPGKEGGFDCRLLEELVQEFDAIAAWRMRLSLDDEATIETAIQQRYGPAWLSHDAFDSQALIDALMERFAGRDNIEEPLPHETDYALFSPLLNYLHAAGKGPFVLDYHSWQLNPLRPGKGLEGTPERPLSMTYMPADDFSWSSTTLGTGATNCHVEAYGCIQNIGPQSADSDYVIHGRAGYLGLGAQRCTFMFPSVRHAELRKDITKAYRSGIYEVTLSSNRDRKSLTVILPRKKRGCTWGSDFFGSGNRLLISDGRGSWKEVKP